MENHLNAQIGQTTFDAPRQYSAERHWGFKSTAQTKKREAIEMLNGACN